MTYKAPITLPILLHPKPLFSSETFEPKFHLTFIENGQILINHGINGL